MPVTAARPNLRPLPRYATIVPDRRVKKHFEYIINFYGTYASIFDYPKSDKQIGTINNVGGQGCTNVLYGYGKKTFWIVAAYNQITEYTVPQTPIKTLSVPSSSMPSSCAMDTSGDLAVGILNGSGAGDIVIFKNASGSGTFMATPLDEEFFDGYDNQGISSPTALPATAAASRSSSSPRAAVSSKRSRRATPWSSLAPCSGTART
jgi:hypothetical protein